MIKNIIISNEVLMTRSSYFQNRTTETQITLTSSLYNVNACESFVACDYKLCNVKCRESCRSPLI